MSREEFGGLMTDTPKVSIVIPVYNGSNYLAEAIESALSQSYSNIEVIVVNDGSNDRHATRNVALKYKDRIRYFDKENGGVSSALNLGISKMLGEYFCWLSHDDILDREKTEIQLAYMQDNNLLVTYTDYRLVDSNGRFLKEIETPFSERLEAMKMLVVYAYVHGCTIMVKKELFNKTGLFNEELKHTQDTDMWFRMSMVLELKRIPKVLISSRIHQSQTSKSNESERLKERYQFYETAIQNPMLQNYLFSSEILILEDDDNALKKSKLLSWLGDKLMYSKKNYSGALYFYTQSIKASTKNRSKKRYKLFRARIYSLVIEKVLGNIKDYLRTYPLFVKISSKIR